MTEILQMPLPGIVIFVHGVNSDGEWYKQCEDGLCKGLNNRLKRRDEHLKHSGPKGGQLTPVKYLSELTDDGYINPDRTDKTFIETDENFSPVIQFRWGYKAHGDDLKKFGSGLYLNEHDYWGGGPFANGCTSLPDLWGDGLDDSLFLWLHVQHLNPTNDRNVYACPPRPYYVLAAHRLAKLVESVRRLQVDVPITIVCHSQGNMIGMAAAFLGDRMEPVTNGSKTGRCVADNYVMCNAPYSLVKKNWTHGWTERGLKDSKGQGGRQTAEARYKTLAAFFEIIRQQSAEEQSQEHVDMFMANRAHGFDAKSDREVHGFTARLCTYGRVTLYFCPHDHVISASTVQGIGWRGMSKDEIRETNGQGVFSQRVFAQNFKVGDDKDKYDFWADHDGKGLAPDSQDFWYPHSQFAHYDIPKGLDASRSFVGKILTVAAAPVLIVATRILGVRINALPPTIWIAPLHAPRLPHPFFPESLRFKKSSTAFDQYYDPPGESRDIQRVHPKTDAYSEDNKIPKSSAAGSNNLKATDSAEGDRDSEAMLRYEHHGYLRFQAKRAKLYAADAKVTQEDDPKLATPAYIAWRTKMIKENMAANVTSHATDHSTIMTNGMHAEKALAYDVAIGHCRISSDEMNTLRVAADWRLLSGLSVNNTHNAFRYYFASAYLQTLDDKEMSVPNWAKSTAEGAMPIKIFDSRAIGAGKVEAK